MSRMASIVSSTSMFAPHHSSPLVRRNSPFKDPRTPPCTPSNTARLWDEFEKRAVENAKKRDTTCSPSTTLASDSQCSPNSTVNEIIKSYEPYSSPQGTSSSANPSPASSRFDFGFTKNAQPERTKRQTTPSIAIASCKTCNQPISSRFGVCEKCKKTIIIPHAAGDATSSLTPSNRNFASTDLPKLHKDSASGTSTPIASTSPKRKAARPTSAQLNELPIRLSSLRPPPSIEPGLNAPCIESRSRKGSLTDPNEPFLRLQISRKPVPVLASRTVPSSPTTPPGTSNSHASHSHTRPTSLANVTTPPSSVSSYTNYSRHVSATPSELSTMFPYCSSSTTTTSPPSVCRASYNLQNTMSAWDDSDSDEEEKTRLIGLWRGKWRGSRGSLGGHPGRRESESTVNGKEECVKERGERRKESKVKRGAFVRVLSCGCSDER